MDTVEYGICIMPNFYTHTSHICCLACKSLRDATVMGVIYSAESNYTILVCFSSTYITRMKL